MTEKLTKQDKKFIKKVIETGNLTQSTKEAYDIEDDNYAAVKGHRLIRKDKIVNAIQSIADSIPDELLTKTHLEGLVATNGESPDYSVRHKYLDTAYKLKGSYAPDKNLNVNVNMSSVDPTDETIIKAINQIQERLENK